MGMRENFFPGKVRERGKKNNEDQMANDRIIKTRISV